MAQSANQALPLSTSAQLSAVNQVAVSAPAQQVFIPAQHQQQALPIVPQQTGIPFFDPAGQEYHYFAAPSQALAPFPPAPLAPLAPPAQQFDFPALAPQQAQPPVVAATGPHVQGSVPAEQQNLGPAPVFQGVDSETSPNSRLDTSDEEFWRLTDHSSVSPPCVVGSSMCVDPRVLVKRGSELVASAPAEKQPDPFSVLDQQFTTSTGDSAPHAEGQMPWENELGEPLGQEELGLLSLWAVMKDKE